MPLPPPRKFTSGIRANTTRLRHSSLINYEDYEDTVQPVSRAAEPSGSSDAASIVNSIVTSVRNVSGGSSNQNKEQIVKETEPTHNTLIDIKREQPATKLFCRPQLNARVAEDRDFLKLNDRSLYTSWSDVNESVDWIKDGNNLLQDILFAICAVRLMPLISIIPNSTIPRFLIILLPILMTHHTVYVDADYFLASWGILTRAIFIPFRIITTFGISWCALSAFNSDCAASTAFIIFLIVSRLTVFCQMILVAVLERRSGAGWVLLRRCALMVWFPLVFMVLQGVLVQRWKGWRDVMWACGGIGEVVAAWLVDSFEKRGCFWSLKATAWQPKRGGGLLNGEEYEGCLEMSDGWNDTIRIRVMRMVALLLATVGGIVLWPTRLGVGEVDASVSVQFVVGPFVVSAFALTLLYCIFWNYQAVQQSPPALLVSVVEKISQSMVAGLKVNTNDLLSWYKGSSLGMLRQRPVIKNYTPSVVSSTPPYALLWRLFHLPVYAGIILMGAGLKAILQDLMDQWIGLAGFKPQPPLVLSVVTPVQIAHSNLNYYVNVTAAANSTFSTVSFIDTASNLWDFTTPKVWLVIGLSTMLVFSNLAGLAAAMSTLKMQKIHQKWLLCNTRLHPLYQSIFEEECGVNTLVQNEFDDETKNDIEKVSVFRNASQRRVNPSSGAAGSIGKTQSLVNFSTFNNRTSRQSFSVLANASSVNIRTPTPSLIGVKESSSKAGGSVAGGKQMTALDNDDKFWRDLLEASPRGSRNNSVGSGKDDEVLNVSTPCPPQKPGKQQSARHVSISLDTAKVPLQPKFHQRLNTAQSVTEDKIATVKSRISQTETPSDIFDAVPIRDVGRDETVGTDATAFIESLPRLERVVFRSIVFSFLARMIVPALVLTLVPISKLLVPVLAPVVGNFGNAIDASTIGGLTAAENGSGFIDGAGWKIVENVEGLVVMCGSAVVIFVSCIGEDVSRHFGITKWMHRADAISKKENNIA
ncbi:hypothetical protein BCR33DRAFT_10198 [Rhizoclosmatium globosum]|uniref:Uncharacterized protein n=1 Tax=Rhizoclosmatium globosum TaxID=329046 RepID=A0A1Y2D3H3_9FUNG|nr:hypothetical protein BCR33DRAFT_10198 [Rhizoclosmatium globosum]|eukprot:ORY53848.1 hypothetical protein BCR33DRAFT_10198 [Rhizoclosmatium globosum]